jgi:serine/threonine-protein kinase
MEVDTSTSAANISEMDGMTLFYIPAGEFEMGSANGDPDERPPHTVYLEAFWIDQTEVTNGMYVRCVEAGACTLPSQKNSRTRLQYYGNPAYEDYPVIYVNWQQANAYCAWAGRRLPTEAQWEKAARGVDGRRFPWGNATPQTTWLNWNGEIGDTSTVGSYLEGASPYGALDMLGNVLEWVSDCYDRSYYRRSPRDNPVGPATCRHAHRVIRGGVSWADTPHGHIDLTNRLNHMENAAIDELGFRCALVP